MESQLHDTVWTSHPYEGHISTHSANDSEHETDAEIEVIIDDGDTDEESNRHADNNETQHGQLQILEYNESSIERPHVGMLFDSAEDAYKFYDRYAREMGFTIRRGSSRRSRKNDVVIWRQYLCYREGWRRDNKTEEMRVKHRRETRVGCQASLVVKLQVGDGTWIVTLFKEKHNHNFETTKKRRLLPPEQKRDGSQEDLRHSMSTTGVKTKLMLNYLSEEAGGSANAGLIEREGISQSFEGELSAHNANESEPEADGEIEVIIDDGESDEECNVQCDINGLQLFERQDTEEDNLEKPHVGMLFDSADDAHQFYERYAMEVGFRVRKGSSSRSRKNDDVIRRQFMCYREGRRCENKNKSEVKHRRETRIGCQANLVVKLRTEDSTWIVSSFEEQHNHDFVKRDLLRSLKKIDGSQGDLIHNITRGNIKVDSVNCLSEDDGGSRNDDFADRDAMIHVPSVRKVELKKADTEALLQYFNALQDANPNFYYAFQLDPNDQLTSLFWSDAISRTDYNCFRDVVCMDATYGTEKYGIPFIPIIGVNHHLQTTYFGGALILNETQASYVWLLETWMSAMNGSHPETILTDQDSPMSEAIARVLPRTRHLYCIWHIFHNAKKNLRHLFKQNCSFAEDFSSCIYTNETIQEFEEGWVSLLAKHSLQGNVWMASLYAKCQQWVPVFSKDTFRADMTTLHRGERINQFFGDYLNGEMLIQEFVTAVDKLLVFRREEELRADYHDNYVLPCRTAHMQIEEDVGKIYTKSVFEKFQDEILVSLRFMAEKVEDNGTTSTFRCWLQNKEYIVNLCLNDFSCRCSCQKFECTGILCSHILKVYRLANVVKIPSQYILKRWTRYAKYRLAVNEEGGQMQEDCQIPYFLRHNSLCHQGMALAAKGASSMEAYKVAKHWLEKALMEVDNALSSDSPGCTTSDKTDAAKISSAGGSKDQVLNHDAPKVKNRGRPGRKDSDQRTKEKEKENPATASGGKESEGVHDQMNGGAKPATASRGKESEGVHDQMNEGAKPATASGGKENEGVHDQMNEGEKPATASDQMNEGAKSATASGGKESEGVHDQMNDGAKPATASGGKESEGVHDQINEGAKKGSDDSTMIVEAQANAQ